MPTAPQKIILLAPIARSTALASAQGAGVAIYLYFQNDLRQREKRELQARSLIRSSEVEFQNLIMSDSYGSWKVKGLVKNNSRYQDFYKQDDLIYINFKDIKNPEYLLKFSYRLRKVLGVF